LERLLLGGLAPIVDVRRYARRSAPPLFLP